MLAELDKLRLELGDLKLDDVEFFNQEGAKAMPEFAASSAYCGTCTASGACSCSSADES
jgi:hypothetical protein